MDWRRKITKLWKFLMISFLNCSTETEAKENNNDPVEYARTSQDLDEHKNFLVKSTDKYSPPEIRGEINYQFKGSTWIFEPKAKDKIDKLQRSILNTKLFSSTGDYTPEGLVSNNKLIIELANAVFLHAAQRYPRGICRSLANKYSKYMTPIQE